VIKIRIKREKKTKTSPEKVVLKLNSTNESLSLIVKRSSFTFYLILSSLLRKIKHKANRLVFYSKSNTPSALVRFEFKLTSNDIYKFIRWESSFDVIININYKLLNNIGLATLFIMFLFQSLKAEHFLELQIKSIFESSRLRLE